MLPVSPHITFISSLLHHPYHLGPKNAYVAIRPWPQWQPNRTYQWPSIPIRAKAYIQSLGTIFGFGLQPRLEVLKHNFILPSKDSCLNSYDKGKSWLSIRECFLFCFNATTRWSGGKNKRMESSN